MVVVEQTALVYATTMKSKQRYCFCGNLLSACRRAQVGVNPKAEFSMVERRKRLRHELPGTLDDRGISQERCYDSIENYLSARELGRPRCHSSRDILARALYVDSGPSPAPFHLRKAVNQLAG